MGRVLAVNEGYALEDRGMPAKRRRRRARRIIEDIAEVSTPGWEG